jgi:hypothetical protein
MAEVAPASPAGDPDAVPEEPHVAACVGTIFVANGGGDLRGATDGFKAAIEASHLPWQVNTVFWSICNGPGLADLAYRNNHRVRGEMLASAVMAFHANHPHQMICLVGWSAGAPVVIEAAKCLPPCSVDHIILLGPSVGHKYDIRPGLRAVRCSLDVFYSSKDCFLPYVCWIFGESDHSWSKIAGVTGFKVACDDNEGLCAKLRQHPWTPEMKEAGHKGGHFDWTGKDFIAAYVLPLLFNYGGMPDPALAPIAGDLPGDVGCLIPIFP